MAPNIYTPLNVPIQEAFRRGQANIITPDERMKLMEEKERERKELEEEVMIINDEEEEVGVSKDLVNVSNGDDGEDKGAAVIGVNITDSSEQEDGAVGPSVIAEDNACE